MKFALAATTAALCAAVAANAEWATLQSNLLTIAFGVSATDVNNVVVTGSADGIFSLFFPCFCLFFPPFFFSLGSGGALLVSQDGFQTWDDAPHDLQIMYMSVDLASPTHGVAGALGFFGQTATGSFTNDGKTWQAAGDKYVIRSFQKEKEKNYLFIF